MMIILYIFKIKLKNTKLNIPFNINYISENGFNSRDRKRAGC